MSAARQPDALASRVAVQSGPRNSATAGSRARVGPPGSPQAFSIVARVGHTATPAAAIRLMTASSRTRSTGTWAMTSTPASTTSATAATEVAWAITTSSRSCAAVTRARTVARSSEGIDHDSGVPDS